MTRQGSHHHVRLPTLNDRQCLYPHERLSISKENYLDHIPKLVDFIIGAESLPPVGRPITHDGGNILGRVILLGHI